ncbi:methyl-accepting chemotaxis protein [Paenibacillus sp. J5C_2022]|uniref:methyl-accepting chemotaxis protein n=1 Tax=Paenibacillus sp. J5C2022 TaxID=2977129 RepID=UPI0021D19FE3|nr:methyl-accepting chemotaxis protein [Paenibacillus sp. J5C2022]MCU6712091.1 methyl-accepting chemotaxis protein [Paenibacillus sp. J5C2022]
MKKLRQLSLLVKIVSLLALVLVLAFGGLIAFNLSQLKDISLEKGELEAKYAGNAFSVEFETQVATVHATLKSLEVTLLEARDNDSLSRKEIVALMQRMLEERPRILGFYTLWEPDAFDGNDAANIGRTSYDDHTGRFLPYVVRSGSDILVEANKDYDKPGKGDYYLIPKQTKQMIYMDPYAWEIDGQSVLLMSVVMPILDEQGAFLGVVGADIAMNDMQAIAEQFKPLGGYVSLVTGSGAYVANPNDPDSIGHHFGDNKQKEQLWQDVIQGKTMRGYTPNSKGVNVLRSFEAIKLPGSDAEWYAVTAVEKEVIFEAYNENRIVSAAMGLAAMLFIGIVVTFIVRFMVLRHITTLIGKLKLMAQGDLTQKLEVRSGDEFGQMAQYFNIMTEKLRDMFRMAADLAMSVGAAAQQLTASAEQTSRASESIAQSTQEIASGAETQHKHAHDTSMAMSEMSLGVQRIADSSTQMSESAGGAADRTAVGRRLIEGAVHQMGLVQSAVVETEGAFGRLSERSDQIGGIIDLIAGISTQTNLLALNAAIEAARVGEQGRGFAVVAGEVRKLAVQTQQAAEQVGQLIEAVRHDTTEAASAMARGAGEVEEGVKLVDQSGDMFLSILSEMETVNGQVQEVSASVQQMTASAEQITATVEQLSGIAQEAAGSAHGVAAASEEQLASMEEISSSAEALSRMVQELLDKMSQFKL